MIAEVCWPCVVGLHEECYEPVIVDEAEVTELWTTCCCSSKGAEADAAAFVQGVGRPVLEPGDISDIKSTGRKRAAMLYPIYEDMQCEWAFLKNAGGGIYPIIGCAGNTIKPVKEGPHAGHRHHGPDKNTIENSPGNVHRICARCHVHWHIKNNPTYSNERPATDQPYLPNPELGEIKKHDDQTLASDEERELDDAYWSRNRVEKKLDVED